MQNPSDASLSRRTFIGALGATSALTVLPGCVQGQVTEVEPITTTMVPPAGQTAGERLLEEFAWNLLEHEPLRASSLGVDTGERAYLRSRLSDASQAGQQAYAATLARDLERARQFPKVGMDAATRTSFEVVESAYATALEGFALPYGDIPVGSWRTAPYPVIQNVGAYIDLPRALDSDHPINTEADAEAYIARLEQYPAVLAGELDRMKAERAMGVIPPDFLLDRAIDQMERQLADARQGGSMVESLVRRTREEGIAGDWETRASAIVTGRIAPALEAQLAELQRERAVATSDPAISARPNGDEWYRWALKPSTPSG